MFSNGLEFEVKLFHLSCPPLLFILLLFLFLLVSCAGTKTLTEWPAEIREISYLSAADSTMQPALIFSPQSVKPIPLLVALHTWSGDYRQKSSIPYAEWCIENRWAMIHPDFRGPNNKPAATGSDLVIDDILSAVEYSRQNLNIDTTRIYLIGSSGGGYTSLLMAGRRPEIWAGVSAWVPITDLEAWYYQTKSAGLKYASDLAQSCGGIPGENHKIQTEYVLRSPLTYLKNARNVDIDINAGIHDGHTGSVPVSHSLKAFNELANPEDRLTEKEINCFVQQETVPSWLQQSISGPVYDERIPLFRRQSHHVRITIFQGGHEIVFRAGLEWLKQQSKVK